jgi:hypothetical protein
MRFPLTAQLVDEARRFELRSACRDCFFWRPSSIAEGACAHGWPDEGQRRWPIDAPDPDGNVPAFAAFCKEFELR